MILCDSHFWREWILWNQGDDLTESMIWVDSTEMVTYKRNAPSCSYAAVFHYKLSRLIKRCDGFIISHTGPWWEILYVKSNTINSYSVLWRKQEEGGGGRNWDFSDHLTKKWSRDRDIKRTSRHGADTRAIKFRSDFFPLSYISMAASFVGHLEALPLGSALTPLTCSALLLCVAFSFDHHIFSLLSRSLSLSLLSSPFFFHPLLFHPLLFFLSSPLIMGGLDRLTVSEIGCFTPIWIFGLQSERYVSEGSGWVLSLLLLLLLPLLLLLSNITCSYHWWLMLDNWPKSNTWLEEAGYASAVTETTTFQSWRWLRFLIVMAATTQDW